MARKDDERSYDGGPVGHKKPPARHQFKNGGKKPAGSGRKKGVRNARTLIEQLHQEEKDLTLEGVPRRLRKKEIFIRHAYQQALTGSLADKIRFIKLCEMLAPGSADPPEPIRIESIPGDEGL